MPGSDISLHFTNQIESHPRDATMLYSMERRSHFLCNNCRPLYEMRVMFSPRVDIVQHFNCYFIVRTLISKRKIVLEQLLSHAVYCMYTEQRIRVFRTNRRHSELKYCTSNYFSLEMAFQ